MKLPRSTLVNGGIAVLGCASALAVALTSGSSTTSDAQSGEQDLLPQFHSDTAAHVELERAGQKLVLERTPGLSGGSASFQLLSPTKQPADAASADKFLGVLQKAHALRAVDSGPPLSAFGLDKPLLRISVQAGKSSYRLLVGNNAPTPQGARYVQVTSGDDAARLVVVDKSVADDLTVDLDSFRERSVVPLAEPEVTRIVIASPSLSVTLERSSGIAFLIDGQPKILADRETLSSFFFQLSRLTASRFLTAEQGKAALTPAHGHFELDTRDPKQTVIFDVASGCPGDAAELVLVKSAPDAQSVCVARELEATLRLTAADFVDRHPFSLHVDEVEELDITGGKAKFALLRKGSGFVLHTGGESQVELEAGNQRIRSLLDAVGERVDGKRPSELGLDPARASITLRSSAARDADVVEQVVRVGNSDSAGNTYLYRERDGLVLRIPQHDARYFAPDSTLLYARKLTEFGLSSFISAEITGTLATQVLRRGESGALELTEPKGFVPDGAASADLIQALGALTAERFVADRDDGSFGLANASLSVHFTFKSDSQTKVEHTLGFGDETALGVYATLDAAGPVFVLQRSVRDTCDTLLINRSLFPTIADSLSGLGIEAHGRSLRLERRGDQLSAVPAGSFAQERVPDVLDALSNLRPDAAIHAGPALPREGLAKPSLTLRLTPKVGPPQTVTFGAGDSWRETSVFYVRVAGVDATFVMAQSKVRALSDAL